MFNPMKRYRPERRISTRIFSVESQFLSLGKLRAYKLRDRWIPVPLPPPVLLRPTFSAGFQRTQNANNGGHSRVNLRTALSPSGAEILSLAPFVSKPPHFADLVRFS
jgi:hypothetical protein